MLAATRPSQSYQQSNAQSRPSSRSSAHSTSSAVSSPAKHKSENLAARAASNASGQSAQRSSVTKKTPKSQPTKESTASPQTQQTPGIITLTEPLSQQMQSSKPSGSVRNKKTRESAKAANEAVGTPIKNGRSRRSKNSPKGDSSLDLLSRSAPTGPVDHNQRRSHNEAHNFESTIVADSSGLTWQQEMFAADKSNGDSTRTNKPSRKAQQSGSTKHDGNLAQPQKVGQEAAALTWQQELFGSHKHVGAHADVFADARDAETFGDEPSSHNVSSAKKSSKRRPRGGSFGSGTPKNGKAGNKRADFPLLIDDLFDSSNSGSPAMSKSGSAQGKQANQYPSYGAPIHYDTSTPVKKGSAQQHPAVAATIAYAGPNFHNSPSPASLPAPKFQSRLAKTATERPSSVATTSSSGDSGVSDGESELTRGARSSTAPAQPTASSKEANTAPSYNDNKDFTPIKPTMQPGATVESLLARMMGGARFN